MPLAQTHLLPHTVLRLPKRQVKCMAERAEERKVEKYHCLPASHLFCPVAIETLGASCWATVTGSDKGHWAKDCIRDGRVQSRGVPVAALVSGGTERKLCSCAGGYWDLTVSQ